MSQAKMNRSFEVWFSPGAHSGAGAHNDGYCESVVSLQLRGDKRWRTLGSNMICNSVETGFDWGKWCCQRCPSWIPLMSSMVVSTRLRSGTLTWASWTAPRALWFGHRDIFTRPPPCLRQMDAVALPWLFNMPFLSRCNFCPLAPIYGLQRWSSLVFDSQEPRNWVFKTSVW